MPHKITTFRPVHQTPAAYESAAQRRADKAFYCSAAWRRVRAAVLREQPLCVLCLKEGRTTAASHVDHILERKVRPDLAFDMDNLQALCQPCHQRKRFMSNPRIGACTDPDAPRAASPPTTPRGGGIDLGAPK